MAKDRHVYGEIDNQSDLKKVFSEIRGDVRKAKLYHLRTLRGKKARIKEKLEKKES